MKRIFVAYLTLVCALCAGAQTYTDHLQASVPGQGSVRITESDAVSSVVNGKINVSQETKPAAPAAGQTASASQTPAKPAASTSSKPVPAAQAAPAGEEDAEASEGVDTSKKVIKNAQKITGYRVQVFSGGNSREDKTRAENTGEQIKRLFPGEPVYVHFYSPRWICRMGNYRTYEEAQGMLARVKEAGFGQASLVKGPITPTD